LGCFLLAGCWRVVTGILGRNASPGERGRKEQASGGTKGPRKLDVLKEAYAGEEQPPAEHHNGIPGQWMPIAI